MRKLIAALVVLLISISTLSETTEKVIDEGTNALSPNSTAIWLINESESGEHYVPFVVVFRGSENWHEQKVVVSDNLSSDPVRLNWKVGDDISIKINYKISSNEVEIFGSTIDLGNGNIIMVDKIDSNPVIVNTDLLEISGKSQTDDLSNYLLSNSESVSNFIK